MVCIRRFGFVLAFASANIIAPGADAQAVGAAVADAAQDADWARVRALVDEGAGVDERQGDGATALLWASYWDDREIADLLIRAGADVNAANDLGVTALWAASENGSSDMVATLLGAGADPNATLPSGETPLMTAARTGNADVVEQLLAHGADVNAATEEGPYGKQTALMWAVAQRHPEAVEVLLAHGADVHARSSVFIETVKTVAETLNAGQQCLPRDECYIIDNPQGGSTPLLFAARVGDLASAKLLVAAGANVNDLAPRGTSVLVVAAHSGHGELAAFLLEQGADPNAAAAGYSALHAAIMQKDAELVRALLAAGADPNARVEASTPTRRDSVDFYLHPSWVGATAFWLAARFRDADIMRLLAEHGADPLAAHNPEYWAIDRNNFGGHEWVTEGETTALMAAVGIGGRNTELTTDHRKRVAEHGPVALHQPDRDAVEAMTLEAVKVAVELGVDVNVANSRGQTALEVARASRYDRVVAFLVEHGATM
jgi:ankyrin